MLPRIRLRARVPQSTHPRPSTRLRPIFSPHSGLPATNYCSFERRVSSGAPGVDTKQRETLIRVEEWEKERREDKEEDLSWVPEYCLGCGAPKQRVDSNLPGYYSHLTRRQRFGDLKIKSRKRHTEDNIFHATLERLRSQRSPDDQTPAELGEFLQATRSATAAEALKIPPLVCNRCHGLRYHHRASDLPAYPTLETLSSMLANSPHRQNHIYHLIDAADLPMSLQPGLREHLRNVLSREVLYGLTISYIVTRADILMPCERQISSLMTWIKKTIKDALPEDENIETAVDKFRAISVRNGWGVSDVKEEIRCRTGGVWIIGGINVGKSRFVQDMWPEGGESRAVTREEVAEYGILPQEVEGLAADAGSDGKDKRTKGWYEYSSNPLQIAPTVSNVPGTTAAPIKIAYRGSGPSSRGWGEMIDLPGFERWVGFGENGLLKHVRDEKKTDLVMDELVKSDQYTIRAGQSMILGGLIVITPLVTAKGALSFLAYPFTALPVHVSANRKSLKWLECPNPQDTNFLYFRPQTTVPLPPNFPMAQQPIPPQPAWHEAITSNKKYKGTPPAPPKPFIPPLVPTHFSSAAVVKLCTDVTLKCNPKLTVRDLEDLPYVILGADIVLEGIGWVEVNVQISKKHLARIGGVVEVEVFTPEGKGVAARVGMGAAMLRREMQGRKNKGRIRPRRAMKGAKKAMKLRQRQE